ncbi:MAG: hypothetical protein NTW87_03465 [Planctomycetota bacterium]|nr:hypothetical protein [Planctomycetota bacterium]
MSTTRMFHAVCLVLAGGLAAPIPAADAPQPTDRTPAGMVRAIKILPDKAPDCSSLKTIVETVTRDCKSNDEKMVALNNFMRISHYHRAYPPGGPALKWFTCYGWSLCGGLAQLQMSLYSQIPGWSWRGVHVPGHNMSEAKYDGNWHWVDCFTKFYTWRPDANVPGGRTIASHEDIKADPNIVTETLVYDEAEKVVYDKRNRKEIIDGKLNWTAPALLVCGDSLKYCVWLPGTKLDGESTTPDQSWTPGAYSAEVNLLPCFSLENTWGALAPPDESWPIKDKEPVGHTCGNKDFRNDPVAGPVLEPYFERVRSYSNGRLIFAPEFSSLLVLKSFAAVQNVKVDGGELVPEDPTKPASVTVNLESPYVIVKINGTVTGEDVSASGMKMDGANFTALVPGYSQQKQTVKIEIKKSLKTLRLEAILMNNAGVLPYLSPGKNKVTVSVADPKALDDNKLVVTYAYAPGSRDKSFEEMFREGKRLFSQQYATWEEKPTVVQKTFTANDLPATFEIDVPTPRGRYPVYPRMLFVRREVIAANGKPLPLPDGTHAPKISEGDELMTLPSPFLIGYEPPAAAKQKAQQ